MQGCERAAIVRNRQPINGVTGTKGTDDSAKWKKWTHLDVAPGAGALPEVLDHHQILAVVHEFPVHDRLAIRRKTRTPESTGVIQVW
jgi:hypothetical protein